MAKEIVDGVVAEPANVISPETGQLDERFALWRVFCGETGVSIDTLPGDLQGSLKERWEKLKEEGLHKPAENRT
ncbi:MAG: hypothetical protein WKF84_24635 [Pyrinomonadaceae bacterium]